MPGLPLAMVSFSIALPGFSLETMNVTIATIGSCPETSSVDDADDEGISTVAALKTRPHALRHGSRQS